MKLLKFFSRYKLTEAENIDSEIWFEANPLNPKR